MTEYNRAQILKELKFNEDDPDFDSDFFNFEEFKQQLVDFLLGSDIKTPYTIAIHGEWGEGKTSLIGRVYDAIKVIISEKSKNDKLSVIWLDAWQYQKLDPVGALFQMIIDEYRDHPNLEEFKRVAKGVSVVVLDIFLKSVTLKTTTLEDVENLVEML
jgi:predicted KAP-like P-loop ATPase